MAKKKSWLNGEDLLRDSTLGFRSKIFMPTICFRNSEAAGEDALFKKGGGGREDVGEG